jgi:hypothetical protein
MEAAAPEDSTAVSQSGQRDLTIGLSVGGAVLLLVFMTVFALWCRRRKSKPVEVETPMPQGVLPEVSITKQGSITKQRGSNASRTKSLARVFTGWKMGETTTPSKNSTAATPTSSTASITTRHSSVKSFNSDHGQMPPEPDLIGARDSSVRISGAFNFNGRESRVSALTSSPTSKGKGIDKTAQMDLSQYMESIKRNKKKKKEKKEKKKTKKGNRIRLDPGVLSGSSEQ